MATTRVVFDPLFAVDRQQQRKLADGARVRLTQFGEVNSTPSGEALPAKLRLIGIHIDRARQSKQTNVVPIAELAGNLRLQPENGLPIFEGDVDDAGLPLGWVGLEPAGTNPALEPRLLRFEFAEEQFRQVPTDNDASVVVTVDPKQFPYLEVQVELEVSGAVEVPREKNDHLDVLITKFNPPKAFSVEPRTPPPAKPPPSPPPVKVEPPEPDLPETGDGDKLVPLKSGGKFRDSKVKFDIEINGKAGFTSDKTTVSVVDGSGATLYEEVFEKEGYMRTVGTHTWLWDGFGANEVLDTKLLIDQKLRLVVTVEKGAHKASGTLKLKNEAEDAPWTDVRIDLKAKQVDLTFYVNCQNEGDLASADFTRLVGLIKSGIAKYWSRSITVDSNSFNVQVAVVERSSDSIPLDVFIETDADYARSHNSGVIDGSMFYNQGFFGGANAAADQDFEGTAAHEFGHSVLQAAGGISLSWTHKGSTTLAQTTSSRATTHPTTGEIDLMQYYTDREPADFYARVIAAEIDVKRAIGNASIDFDD